VPGHEHHEPSLILTMPRDPRRSPFRVCSALLAVAAACGAAPGCAASEGAATSTRSSAPAAPPAPAAQSEICVDGQLQLASGFKLTRQVDYVAARYSACKDVANCPVVIHSLRGEPCKTAHDRESCLAKLGRSGFLTHLATTAGDDVVLWNRDAPLALFGTIDAPAEALWLLREHGYDVDCRVKTKTDQDGVVVDGAGNGIYSHARLRVHADGTIELLSSTPPQGATPAVCGVVGCSDRAEPAADLPVTFDELKSATITVCRNDECLSGDFAMLAGSPTINRDADLLLPGSGSRSVEVLVGTQDGARLWLLARWELGQSHLAVRDQFSVAIEDSDHREVFATQDTVSDTQDIYPNGPTCDAIQCLRAIFDTRADPDPWTTSGPSPARWLPWLTFGSDCTRRGYHLLGGRGALAAGCPKHDPDNGSWRVLRRMGSEERRRRRTRCVHVQTGLRRGQTSQRGRRGAGWRDVRVAAS
jgi:hypothetical protein